MVSAMLAGDQFWTTSHGIKGEGPYSVSHERGLWHSAIKQAQSQIR